MKLTCQYRRKDALLYAFTVITAFIGSQSVANPFNDGTTNSIVTDITYNETLYIGVQNPDNTLLIESNATVAADSIVIGQLTSSTNNSVSVVGSSLLIAGNATTNGLSTGGVIVGGADGGAALSINNASTLVTEYLYVGFGTNDSGRIDLAGEGTELTVAQDAQVGTAGSTNSIEIADGANLSVSGTLTVGSASSTDNHVNVASGGSLFVNETNNIVVVNADGDNGIAVKGNGTLQVGGDVNTGTLSDLGVSMSNNANLELGGELTISNNKIDNSLNIILNNNLSTNTASWTSGSLTAIGGTTSDNSLTFTNGATGLASNIVQIGQQSTSARNELNVGGSNTLFEAISDVFVGAEGDNNKLNIGDGGQVVVGGSLYLGGDTSSTGNQVNINSNGVLNVGDDIVVGDSGNENTFTIASGQVDVTNDFILGSGSINNRYNQIGGTNTVGGSFIIGETEGATGKTGNVNDDLVETTGNLAIIGTNATLNIQQDLTVGLEGGGSIMTIRDGGTVTVDGDTVIGEAVGDNYIYLQRDSNTQFNVTGDLVVGKNEEGSNRFAVYGGTANIGGNFYLGATTNQHEIKNFVYLETTNAALNVANALYIGASNSINTLDIVDGATVRAQDLYVGTYEGVSNNVVTVKGENSLLYVTNNLGIGSSTGTNNSVVIENGGILNVTQTNIVINGTNNTLNIADGGTLQTIDWSAATADEDIVLGPGATLELGGAFSGTNRIDGSYELFLNGALATNIAQWNTGSGNMFVGYASDGNTLTAQDGAMAATDTDLIVGHAAKTTGNELNVIGSGSLIDVGNNLLIGRNGSSDNQLTIEDSGQVDVGNNLIIGADSNNNTGLISSLSNTVSTLNIGNTLTIGKGTDASGNNLEIGDNATVTVGGSATIGATGARNGSLLLAGTNSVLSIGTNLVVGTSDASGNLLLIEDGGQATVGQDLTIGSQAVNNNASISGLTNAVATLDIGNNLTIGKGANASGNDLEIGENATVTVGGSATIGAAGARNGSLLLTGTNSVLSIGTNLVVGAGGASGNALLIEDGAQASVGRDLTIGNQADNNNVTLSGLTNAVFTLDIGNDLTIGKGTDASGNSMEISDNAAVNVSGLVTIGDNANNNQLELTADNAIINALTNFVIGADDATGNKLTISAGTAIITGDLIIGKDEGSSGNTASISGTNSILQVLSDLYVGNDGSGNALTISDGGVVEAVNAYIGFTTNSQDNVLSIQGTNSSLTIAETLYAGYEGDNNSIDVSDGALLQVTDTHIGYASSGNKVDVHGTNAVFAVLNDLFIGNADTNAFGQNELWVYDEAITTVGGNLAMQSNSVLYIDAGSQVTVAGNYSQDESSILVLRISTNSTTTNLTVGATASFAKDTTFELLDDETAVGTTNDVSRALVAAGSLEIDEQTATQELLNDYILIGNDLLDFSLILSNNIIWIDNVTRLSLASQSGLEFGSQLADIADDIDFMADGTNDIAKIMRDFMDTLDTEERNDAFHNYYGEKMSSTPAHNTINMGMQSVAEQLTKRADSTRARMGMASTSSPEGGAGGPHMAEQSMQGWVAGYKTWADKSSDSGFDGYDGSIGGFLIGADLSVAEGIMVGIAGGAGNATLDKDNGASTDTDTTFGSIYMSAGTKDWFVDASLIFGGSSIDTALGSTFDTTASYDALNTAIYVGGGKEIIGDYLIITPQASLLGNYYKQDSYEENSSNAVARAVDSFDTLYLQSSIGCNVGFYTAMGETIIKPEFRAFWVHEFNAKEEDVSFQLVDGTGTYNMQLQAPESDIIKLGAGLSAKIGEYLELRADLDTRRGSNYSDHTLLGSIRYRF